MAKVANGTGTYEKGKADISDKESTSSSDDISSSHGESKSTSAEAISEEQINMAKTCIEQEDVENDKLLSHFRQVQQNRGDQDIVNLTSTYLNRVYADKLTEPEKLSLECWLTGRLEDERKNWKKQLAIYVKEVEKERHMAQEAHEKTEFLRTKLEYFLQQYAISPDEPYIPAEQDVRAFNSSLIDSYLEVLGQTLQIYQVERAGIVQLLTENEDEEQDDLNASIPLTEFVKDKIKFFEDSLKLRDIKIQELEDTMSSDFKRHTEEMTRVKKESKETEKSQGLTIKSLTMKLQSMNSMEQLLMVKSSSTGFVDKAVQVDLNTPRSSIEPIHLKKFFHIPDNDKQNSKCNPKFSIDGTTVSAFHPPSGDAEYHSDDTEKRKKISRVQNKGERSQAEVMPTIESPQTPLYKACSDSSLYKSNLLVKAEEIREGVTHYHDGYLSGTRKEIMTSNTLARTTELILQRAQHFKRQKENNTSARLSPSKNRCLRCHKLYHLRDNHKLACRFHPKGKRKMEKYDNKGKLLLVTYIWECCLQHAEALGCSSGEHV